MVLLKAIKKVVLVDFDGVVLKNKLADKSVAKRAGIYTWKKINNHKPINNYNISPSQADDMCYNLYKGYGHTLTGLKHIGINDCNMKEYNKLIYDTIDYKKVCRENNNFDDMRILINYCHECQYEIFFFSNAPYRWMSNILKNDEDILSSVDDVRRVLGINEDDDNFIKPQSSIYDKINSHFNKENIVFIDDNIGNIKPVINNVTWTNIVFSSANKKINNRLFFADSLERVTDII
jgi:FMN phosphatase YigB (HAD superfamily)